MSVRKKKDAERGGALHDATHGQFGKEPRPNPLPDDETRDSGNSVEDRIRAARKRSKNV